MDEILPVPIYIARWLRLGQQLANVHELLSWWDEWRANEARPPDLQADVPPPTVRPGDLKELQELLVDQLGELEGGFIGRN